MSDKEKKSEEPKLYVREWKLVPGEWRPATKEEIEEFKKSSRFIEVKTPILDSIEDFFKRLRRFEEKIEEAFNELFGT